MPEKPSYRLIYNWDGAPYGYSEVPQSQEAFLNKVYAPLEGTQVDALFWNHFWPHTASWPSQVLEWSGDLSGRRYTSTFYYRATENMRQAFERGEDWNRALIHRGHDLGIAVFPSVRMNDNHFGGMQPSKLDRMHPEMTALRAEHPEWLLGDTNEPWFAASWNMAIPEVRQHRYEHVAELCRLYDWDGVELDWQRHAFHFPADEAYRLRYLLTDLQRALREVTNDIGRQRGRPFYLAARVSGSLEGCHRIGYDVERWVREGLLDMLIPAANAGTDPSIDVGEFLSLTQGTDVRVYPGFDSGVPLPKGYRGLEPEAWWRESTVRATAARYHDQGAHGIYLFNWHAARDTRRGLMTQIGASDRLAGTTKVYQATPRYISHTGPWAGAYNNDRLRGEVPVTLYPTLTLDGPCINIDLVDDLDSLAAEELPQAELRLCLEEWTPIDGVVVRWDGVHLEAPIVRCREAEDPLDPSDVSAVTWLVYPLAAGQVGRGSHQVQVALAKRNPQMLAGLVLSDVELHVVFDHVDQIQS